MNFFLSIIIYHVCEVTIICNNTEEKVKKKTTRNWRKCKDGGYVVTSASSVTPQWEATPTSTRSSNFPSNRDSSR